MLGVCLLAKERRDNTPALALMFSFLSILFLRYVLTLLRFCFWSDTQQARR